MEIVEGLGIKKITFENHLDTDDASTFFARLTSEGKFEHLDQEYWIGKIYGYEVGASVPKELKTLFEVARGTMVYGYYFYPIYTLASQQLYRIAEAALRQKYKDMDGPNPKAKFYQIIDWLDEREVIIKENWDKIREIRNYVSHPESQMINLPASALLEVKAVSEILNYLFMD